MPILDKLLIRVRRGWIPTRNGARMAVEEPHSHFYYERDSLGGVDHRREPVVRTGRSPPTSGVSPIRRRRVGLTPEVGGSARACHALTSVVAETARGLGYTRWLIRDSGVMIPPRSFPV